MTVFSSRHRRTFFIAIGLLGAVTVASLAVVPRDSHAEAPPAASATDRAGLQRQRIETLRQASDVAHQMVEKGLTNAEEAFRIDRLLLDAQLESAVSAQEQLHILQGALEMAKKQEQLTVNQQRAGIASPLAPLEAKAYRLQIEIELSKLAAK